MLFRSALWAQAAGRAGRAEKPGDVVFQTYQPEHYSITCAAAGDYENFYRQEIAVRQMLHYPPISNILEVLVFSKEQKKTVLLSEQVHKIIGAEKEITILGPGDPVFAKLRDFYRRVLFVKAVRYQTRCVV